MYIRVLNLGCNLLIYYWNSFSQNLLKLNPPFRDLPMVKSWIRTNANGFRGMHLLDIFVSRMAEVQSEGYLD